MQKKLQNSCVCQKKAVLLHPLLRKAATYIATLAQLVEQRIRNA